MMKHWTSQELDSIDFQVKRIISLPFFYLTMVLDIQLTQEVSFESKSGKKTAKFKIKLNYIFLAFLQVIPYSVGPGIQGYCIAASLMVVLPVWMKQNQSQENGD